VSRTRTGFEYAIVAIKEEVTEFVVYLRNAAAKQLDWDTKVLKSRSRQIEMPSQSRQRKDNSSADEAVRVQGRDNLPARLPLDRIRPKIPIKLNNESFLDSLVDTHRFFK
jgi:hypothetical protein